MIGSSSPNPPEQSLPQNHPEIFVRGINKKATRLAIIEHFSSILPPSSTPPYLKWTDSPKQLRTGHCWLTYSVFEHAKEAVRLLHHSNLLGTTISVTLECKVDQNYYFPLSTSHSSVIQRRIRIANEPESSSSAKKKQKISTSVSYSRNGVLVGGAEYPTPQGVYIRKLLETRHSCGNEKLQLFNIVLDNKFGTHHTKELSESMAMINALYRLGELTNTNWSDALDLRTIVYVLGDGKVPFTAATMAIYMPPHWRYVSIDPLMNFDVQKQLGGTVYAETICVECSKSEEYAIPEVLSKDSSSPVTYHAHTSDTTSRAVTRSIVIACHSHAPLQEFWDRLDVAVGPKYCIAMPCCKEAEWSSLAQAPLYTYDDFEVFSPKRKIYLYYSADDANDGVDSHVDTA